MSRPFLVIVSVLILVAAGCGGSSKPKRSIQVYFLRAGELQPVARDVSANGALEQAALDALRTGPTAEERHALKLVSGFDGGTYRPVVRKLAAGVATLDGTGSIVVGGGHGLEAQIVFTLTQFPSVRSVVSNPGAIKAETRADFEDVTPAILVESPLPEAQVKSPLRITGTANTFEATFQYELVDSAGKVIAHHFVTATSGSGTRGTFDVTVPYPSGHAGQGKLVVYENSAADGSRIHVVKIPLRLAG